MDREIRKSSLNSDVLDIFSCLTRTLSQTGSGMGEEDQHHGKSVGLAIPTISEKC